MSDERHDQALELTKKFMAVIPPNTRVDVGIAAATQLLGNMVGTLSPEQKVIVMPIIQACVDDMETKQ